MTSATLVGSTGRVGSHILSTLTAHPSFTQINAYTRSDLPLSDKLKSITSSDTSTWPTSYPKDSTILFSGLGTTRARAGGLENQRKIDHDLNLEIAKAAQASGTSTYVLISSGAANSSSYFPYLKMKGELEDAVKALGFKHVVIVRPGLIVGNRKQPIMAESIMGKLAGFMGGISGSRLKDFWAQDDDVIAKAAVTAGLKCLNGEVKEAVWELGQADIVRLGRTEWKH